MRTDFIFYAIAIVCFIGFLACLAWYYNERRKPKNNKTTLNWTIESAKKFLEENDKSKDNQPENKKTEKVVIIKKDNYKKVNAKQLTKAEATQSQQKVEKQNIEKQNSEKQKKVEEAKTAEENSSQKTQQKTTKNN